MGQSVAACEGVKTAAQMALPGGRGAWQRMAAGEQQRYALPVLRKGGAGDGRTARPGSGRR